MSSKIYLPNGGIIEIYNGWTQTRHEDGTIMYKEDEELLLTISTSGTVITTSRLRHTYYPPKLADVNDASRIVLEQIKNVERWRLQQLKKALAPFNAKTANWK